MPNLSGTEFGLVFDGHSSACAWNMGVFLWAYKQFQATLFSQNCTDSPSGAVAGIVANWFEGATWPLCMDAFAPRLYAAGTAAIMAFNPECSEEKELSWPSRVFPVKPFFGFLCLIHHNGYKLAKFATPRWWIFMFYSLA
ncbi:hypothetical protein [Shewanella chilikensis]|uniref:hypothetical protein n=1 Tax=Shewanella chilikensis TaxID=558541 RepID=UPI001F332C74|nr:hypothetical protein [Shewanella chilikensis]MCE9788983.1 hypothetical protein [Shewanella chilikensis]